MARALQSFDQIYVINLPNRADRRAEMSDQLARVGMDLDHPKVTLFDAVRPTDPGPFDRIGTRGAFLSHLGVLKHAHAAGYGQILILEDDADLTQKLLTLDETGLAALAQPDWDMLYLGHQLDPGGTIGGDGPVGPVQGDVGILLAHALGIRSGAMARLIPYLEAMTAREAGDPKGGPMHVDGAYSWFRKEHQDIVTFASRAQLLVQRASKTDIHPTGWKENLPFIGWMRRMKNKLSRR